MAPANSQADTITSGPLSYNLTTVIIQQFGQGLLALSKLDQIVQCRPPILGHSKAPQIVTIGYSCGRNVADSRVDSPLAWD